MEPQNSFISNFRKFLFAFILPVLVSITIATIIFNYYFEHHILLGSEINGSYKINRIINEVHPSEIPIFGSSRAEGCYVPDSIIPNCFNYGLSGTQDDVALFFISEELKKIKNTPIIINFDLDGLNNSIGYIEYYLYNIDSKGVRKLINTHYKSIFSLPFVKYYGYFEQNFKYYMNGRLNFTKIVNHGGSFEKNALPREKFGELVKQRINTVNYFHNDPELKKELFKLIRSTEREFIFVIAPYHPSFFENFQNKGEYEKFKTELLAFNHVKIFDYSQSIKDDSLFFDTSHLNYKGALIFSAQLRNQFKRFQ